MLVVGEPVGDIALEPNPIPSGHEPDEPVTSRMNNTDEMKRCSL